MKKRVIWIMLMAALAVSLAACATYEPKPAGVRDPFDIHGRIQEQQRRIDTGIASGELTRREADIVQLNLNNIRMRYSNLRSDGALTQRELEKLDRMLDRNGRMIFNKKHNPVERIF